MKLYTLILTSISLLNYNILFSQNTTQNTVAKNSIQNVSKDFEECFYDALSARLIENYKKATQLIKKCIEIDDSKPVLYYELALNEIAEKKYNEAEKNLKRALKGMPNNETLLLNLQQAYAAQTKYDEAISTLKKLIEIDPKHQINLARIYIYTKQYGKSLDLLNAYQKQFYYNNQTIEALRNRIYFNSKDRSIVIIDLEKALERNNKNEKTYLKLIRIYKEVNKKDEALRTFERFKKEIPNSPLIELVLFENALDANDTTKATEIITRITNNNNISDTEKQKALTNFRTYGKQNPNIKEELNNITPTSLAQENNLKFFMELSSFQLKKGSTESLLEVYKNNLNIDPNNYDLIKDTLLLQLYYGKYEQAETLSAEALEKYPSQPLLYLINGVLLTKKKKHKEAINFFMDGLDYIVENPELERALYLKLGASYEAMGVLDKAKKYRTKGEQISIP